MTITSAALCYGRCGITKLVDDVKTNDTVQYCDNPILRLVGDVGSSKVIEKIVSAKDLFIDKILVCFAPASPYQMFKTNTFFSGLQAGYILSF